MAVSLEIKRGSTFQYFFQCVDELDVPVDMTGWEISSDLKLGASREKLISFTVGDADISQGTVILSATPEQTLNLPPTMDLDFDIKFTTTGGEVYYSEDINLKTSKHITH